MSRKGTLLTILWVEMVAFNHHPGLYENDEDFGRIRSNCSNHIQEEDFHLIEGFLFKCNQLCVPHTSLKEVLIKEAHAGGSTGHFGQDKCKSRTLEENLSSLN